jgi:hypothetical protein
MKPFLTPLEVSNGGQNDQNKCYIFFNRGGPGNVPWSLVPHGPTTGALAGPKQVKMVLQKKKKKWPHRGPMKPKKTRTRLNRPKSPKTTQKNR